MRKKPHTERECTAPKNAIDPVKVGRARDAALGRWRFTQPRPAGGPRNFRTPDLTRRKKFFYAFFSFLA